MAREARLIRPGVVTTVTFGDTTKSLRIYGIDEGRASSIVAYTVNSGTDPDPQRNSSDPDTRLLSCHNKFPAEHAGTGAAGQFEVRLTLIAATDGSKGYAQIEMEDFS